MNAPYTVPGGSGPHRWLDPGTREWGENAELCRYNYDRGIYACDRVDQPTQLLIGRGLSALEAPPERIFSAANLCDEAVPLQGGGSEPRYRASGVISADEVFGDVADVFAAAMGGIVIQPEGSVAVEPGHGKSPVAYITDDDLVSGTKVTFSDFRSEADEEWANTVIPSFIDPSQKWASRAAPIRRNSADVLADGGPREAPISLRLVKSITQAQRIGEIRRRIGRLQRTASLTLGPRFCELEEGDWIVWTSARRTKGLPVQFRIESYALGRDWTGGTGAKPAVGYLGASGIVAAKADAVNLNVAKRTDIFSGVTNVRGVAAIAFSPAFAAVPAKVLPSAVPNVLSGPVKAEVVANSVTKSGCSVQVTAAALLTGVVTALAGATVSVIVIEG
jgi:hypothetical protein